MCNTYVYLYDAVHARMYGISMYLMNIKGPLAAAQVVYFTSWVT